MQERDIHSGLIGPLLICRKDILAKNPVDTQEFMLLFMTFDENKSWYYEENWEILKKTNRKATMDPNFDNNIKFHGILLKPFIVLLFILLISQTISINELTNCRLVPYQLSFYLSFILAINGIIYSLKGLRMYSNQLVNWHLINMGSPKDFHSINFHGQTFINKHNDPHRQGVYPLLPGLYFLCFVLFYISKMSYCTLSTFDAVMQEVSQLWRCGPQSQGSGC